MFALLSNERNELIALLNQKEVEKEAECYRVEGRLSNTALEDWMKILPTIEEKPQLSTRQLTTVSEKDAEKQASLTKPIAKCASMSQEQLIKALEKSSSQANRNGNKSINPQRAHLKNLN